MIYLFYLNYVYKIKSNIQQYDSFYVPEFEAYVNGSLTLQENQADNGGILESFKVCFNIF